MAKNKNKRISKLMSLALRHKPEAIGVEIDSHGWADVNELIKGIQTKYPFDLETLEEIVRTDEKQRYSFNEDKTKIRANQGHSLPVDLELVEKTPPDELWHGTGSKSVGGIYKNGIIPMSRQYVHLSVDLPTAISVGRRHGSPVVFKIDIPSMVRDGYKFYQSENGIWLTKKVPAKYLIRVYN